MTHSKQCRQCNGQGSIHTSASTVSPVIIKCDWCKGKGAYFCEKVEFEDEKAMTGGSKNDKSI